MAVTDGHYQDFALHATLHLWVPPHEPRESDPHYKLFHAVKARVKALDVPCWRCGVHYADLDKSRTRSARNPLGATQLELHHHEVEFSVQQGIDVSKFAADHLGANITDEESFLAYLESEGNLLQLCDVCHRSTGEGIHHIPEPLWKARRWWRADLQAFIQS